MTRPTQSTMQGLSSDIVAIQSKVANIVNNMSPEEQEQYLDVMSYFMNLNHYLVGAKAQTDILYGHPDILAYY